MKRSTAVMTLTLTALVLAGCDPLDPHDPTVLAPEGPAYRKKGAPTETSPRSLLTGLEPGASPELAIADVNARLAASGTNVALARLEYVTGGAADEAGLVVFAHHRQLRLASRWVPGDWRRGAVGDLLTHTIYAPFAPANRGTRTELDGTPPIDASLVTWDRVSCSNLDLVLLPPYSGPPHPSAVFGGGNPFVADIVSLGFLPGEFFDLILGEDARNSVLGVTFTFIFGSRDAEGVFTPSDVNGDGRNDTALKEVWYNDDFEWSVDGSGGFDVETVALHENGHALELGHFGLVAGVTSSGSLLISPRAVMNAFIFGTLREPLGTDNAAYCGNFGEWPE